MAKLSELLKKTTVIKNNLNIIRIAISFSSLSYGNQCNPAVSAYPYPVKIKLRMSSEFIRNNKWERQNHNVTYPVKLITIVDLNHPGMSSKPGLNYYLQQYFLN